MCNKQKYLVRQATRNDIFDTDITSTWLSLLENHWQLTNKQTTSNRLDMEETEDISHTSSNDKNEEVEEGKRSEDEKSTTMKRCLMFVCLYVLQPLGGLAVFAAIAVLAVLLL